MRPGGYAEWRTADHPAGAASTGRATGWQTTPVDRLTAGPIKFK